MVLIITERPPRFGSIYLSAPRGKARLHAREDLGSGCRQVSCFAKVGGQIKQSGAFLGLDPFPLADACGLVAAALPEHLRAR